MMTGPRRAGSVRHDSGQLRCARDRRLGSCRDHCPSDPARAALLSIEVDRVREGAFLVAVDDVGRAHAILRHAHVERSVLHEGEATLRLVDLHGGDADVEDHAFDRLVTEVARDLVELREQPGRHRETWLLGGQDASGGEGDGVAVESDDSCLRHRKERATISPRSERAVDDDVSISRREGCDDLVEHDRPVKRCPRGSVHWGTTVTRYEEERRGMPSISRTHDSPSTTSMFERAKSAYLSRARHSGVCHALTSGALRSRERQPACKPGSVVASPERRAGSHSSRTTLAGRLVQPTRAAATERRRTDEPSGATPIWSCSRWGLPCRSRCRSRGALLPHPFTLTFRSACAVCQAVCSLWHCP